MATRTQKEAQKKRADAENAAATKAPKAPAKAEAAKSGKPDAKPAASKATPKKAANGKAKRPPLEFREIPSKPPEAKDDKPSWGERFWHALSGKAQKAEAVAHEHKLEREEDRKRVLAAEKVARERADADAREAKRQAAIAERRKAEQSKRELVRIAKEEEARLKEEAHQAKLQKARDQRAEAARKVHEAEEQKRLAHEAKLEAARQAKLEEERLEEERKEQRRQREAERREEARLKKADEEAETERLAAEKAEQRRIAREEQERAAELEREAEAGRAEAARQEQAAKKAEAARAKADAEAAQERAEAEAAKAKAKAKADAEHAKAKADADAAKKAEAAQRKPVPEAAKPAARPAASSPMEAQADRLAEELASRRSKPIVIEAEDDVPVPTLPGVGRNRAKREDGEVTAPIVTEPAPPAKMADAAPRGLSLPEAFILLALEDEWNEKREKAAPGQLGGALAGAMVLELALRGRLHVQRDRLVLTGGPSAETPALDAVERKLAEWQDLPSLQATANLAKWNRELLPAFKDGLKARGYIDHAAWKHLGLIDRSQVVLTDADAQERLRGKLRRAIAGGGTPDASTILALGLLDAAGLFETIVPPGAVDYNRKRLNGLLAGRDVMGYAVDKELKGIQEVAVRTILGNVRLMTVRG